MMNRRGFIAALSAATAMAQDAATDLAGNWQGTLVTAGGSLRLALDITKAKDGVYTGTLTSIDQGGAKIPIEKVKVDGRSVRLEVNSVGGVYEGKMEESKLTGMWTQGGPALPLEFKRGGKPAESTKTSEAQAPQTFPFGLPIDMEVPVGPTPFRGKSKTHLAYELHITHFSMAGQELLLKRIEVLDGSAILASFEGSELSGILMRIGGTGEDKRAIEAGRRAIAFLWVTLADGAHVPAMLRHRITVGDQTVEGGTATVSQAKPLRLGAPLRGSGWMAANGPGNSSPHRRAIIPVEGRAHIAQRFAIDWVKLGEKGGTFEGDAKENRTHFAYGNDVLAVADAVVATVKDGIPENVPGITSRAVPITLETVGGNHIILDLGEGRFAFYAHLQPGSIRVKVGERVERGRVLAMVGNTGNSTEPHLHFHVSDGNSPLGSEGLPYGLEGWREELPMQNERVSF